MDVFLSGGGGVIPRLSALNREMTGSTRIEARSKEPTIESLQRDAVRGGGPGGFNQRRYQAGDCRRQYPEISALSSNVG